MMVVVVVVVWVLGNGLEFVVVDESIWFRTVVFIFQDDTIGVSKQFI